MAGGLVLLLGSGVALYRNNVTTSPYTGRKRFMLFNPSQMRALGQARFTKVTVVCQFRGFMNSFFVRVDFHSRRMFGSLLIKLIMVGLLMIRIM